MVGVFDDYGMYDYDFRNVAEFCTMLILLLHHLLIFRCQIFLPSFCNYRQKGNALIDF